MAVKFDGKKTGLFAAGVLFGTAGIKLLSSKDAKKVYTGCTAAVLRMKDCIMKMQQMYRIIARTFMQEQFRLMMTVRQLKLSTRMNLLQRM